MPADERPENELDDSIPDVMSLSAQDEAQAEQARRSLAILHTLLPPPEPTSADGAKLVHGNDTGKLPPDSPLEPEGDRPSRWEFSVPGVIIANAVEAVSLPPTDRHLILNRESEDWEDFHKLLLTFEGDSLRLTNLANQSKTELSVPVDRLVDVESPQTVAVIAAQLELAFHKRGFRLGSGEPDGEPAIVRPAWIEKVDWRREPPVHIRWDPPARSLHLSHRNFHASLEARPCPTPEPIDRPPQSAPWFHRLAGQALRDALKSAATFSGLATGPRWSVVSVTSGVARGGHSAAFSVHRAGLIEGFEVDFPKSELRVTGAILHRIGDAQLAKANGYLYLSDGKLHAEIKMAEVPFPTIPSTVEDTLANASFATVVLDDLFRGVALIRAFQPLSTPERPQMVNLAWGADEGQAVLLQFADIMGGGPVRHQVALLEVPSLGQCGAARHLVVDTRSLRAAVIPNDPTQRARITITDTMALIAIDLDSEQVVHCLVTAGLPSRVPPNVADLMEQAQPPVFAVEGPEHFPQPLPAHDSD